MYSSKGNANHKHFASNTYHKYSAGEPAIPTLRLYYTAITLEPKAYSLSLSGIYPVNTIRSRQHYSCTTNWCTFPTWETGRACLPQTFTTIHQVLLTHKEQHWILGVSPWISHRHCDKNRRRSQRGNKIYHCWEWKLTLWKLCVNGMYRSCGHVVTLGYAQMVDCGEWSKIKVGHRRRNIVARRSILLLFNTLSSSWTKLLHFLN